MTLRKGEDTLIQALDHTMWRAGFGPVVRHSAKLMNLIKFGQLYF